MGWKIALIFILLFLISCGNKEVIENIQQENIKEGEVMKLTSPAFKDNGAIPIEYTCDGDDISPELNIEGIPKNTKSLALICDDPDAPSGDWVHWVVWNIPVTTKKISKGAKIGVEGTTDFKSIGYRGPCPPSGTHRYFFKLYALDAELNLPKSTQKKDLERAMQGHVLDKAELIGKYSRS